MKEEILRLRRQGLGYREIADRLGLSTAATWRLANPSGAQEQNHECNARRKARDYIAIVDLSPERKQRFYEKGV